MNYLSKKLKKSLVIILTFVISFSWFLSYDTCANASSINGDYKVYVMAPLEKITDWNKFKNELITLKEKGVHALTTDVWWGDVEDKSDNDFSWNYYKKYANVVRESGLKWVPIISTHQCGQNVNDTTSIPLPKWLWSKDTTDNMQIKDELGHWDKETLSPWWSGIEKQYDELYASFASNFSNYSDIIDKIYLSGGPSGELRFPSYNLAFKWDYPERGYLQCYSKSAISDFQNEIKNKYTTISAVNQAWNTNLTSFKEITPPTDGDNFFTNGYKLTYGKDFLNWYQGVLEKHLDKIASIAHKNFDPVFNVRIGAKVSGVHWLINSPSMPHSAEYCAGYYNYDDLLDEFKKSNIDLTFTCLEMNDKDAYKNPMYSAPKSLVINVANLSNDKGIRIFGENALPISNNNRAYENINEMLYNYNFSGFTLLRFGQLFNENGTPKPELDSFANYIIKKPVKVTFKIDNLNLKEGENLYLTGNSWEMANWTTGLYPSKFNYKDRKATVTVNLAEDHTYEFKAIKKDKDGKVTWESGNNHSYTVQSSGGICNFSFNN
ncbi:family 14 glycosylhydrolase [Clostridium taeniosporum]|uniref:Beta-amylase n=1 Tax=Clostridium taeniosporum TaxID=394958 RepID=A0A1D7XJU4_9CLOT|nr:family 14 glycosylhydrolase [Clostridium taeniosporum]AOR23596.1 beta-amylase [Clostridium taeniosporum]